MIRRLISVSSPPSGRHTPDCFLWQIEIQREPPPLRTGNLWFFNGVMEGFKSGSSWREVDAKESPALVTSKLLPFLTELEEQYPSFLHLRVKLTFDHVDLRPASQNMNANALVT